MKTKLIGKVINEFANKRNDMPEYFGSKFSEWPGSVKRTFWNTPFKKVNGEFIAKKYNAILELIAETKAAVNIQDQVILITYKNGEIKLCRDVLIDTFLLPHLSKLN